MTVKNLLHIAEKIRTEAEALTPACASFLQDLIRIPAESCKEKERVARIRQEMEAAQFDQVEVDALGSVVGRVGQGRQAIAFDGHIDQVGVGDPAAWKIDPFAGILKDGVIYGRGASDQLAGFAAALYAGRLVAQLGLQKQQDAWSMHVVGSVMEEDCDGLCWRHLIEEHGLKPDLVVLTEPTSLRVYRGQRGRIELKVTTKGRSCHASMPHLGDNAVYKMAPIVAELEELAQRLPKDDFLGQGSLAVSRIESTSPSLNAVADSCTVYIDRRVIPSDTRQSTMAEISQLPAFQRAGAEIEVLQYEETAYTGKTYGQEKFFPAWAMADDHPLVLASAQTAELARQQPAEVNRWVFSTNGVATCGTYGIPSIGYGPGDEEHAHTVDDQVRVSDLTTAIAFYALLPLVWTARNSKG
jgi:putative selenium metabolism hydrolase